MFFLIFRSFALPLPKESKILYFKTFMKHLTLALLSTVLLAACQESLEDRCAREAKEYTEKKCPAPIGENTILDSIVFERTSHTMHYYYTLSGAADDKSTVEKVNPRANLLQEVRNATSVKTYKDAGYNFTYTYLSKSSPRTVLFETTITRKDYQQ